MAATEIEEVDGALVRLEKKGDQIQGSGIPKLRSRRYRQAGYRGEIAGESAYPGLFRQSADSRR